MHLYHDVYTALPAHASYSKEGKPLTSRELDSQLASPHARRLRL